MEDIKTNKYTITTFHNPATDIINVRLELSSGKTVTNYETMIIELIDIQGKKCNNKF